MEKTTLDKEMPLTAAVRAFMASESWDNEELSVNESRTTSTLATSLMIESQPYKLYIECDELQQQIHVFFYTPFNVPRCRVDVVTRILNRLHSELIFGRLAVDDGPVPRPVQFKCGFDLKGSTLSPTQVDTLIGLGVSTFRMHGEVLAAAALSRRSLDQIWAERLAAEEEHNEWTGVKVPRLLN